MKLVVGKFREMEFLKLYKVEVVWAVKREEEYLIQHKEQERKSEQRKYVF
jgi:hypothetical protein